MANENTPPVNKYKLEAPDRQLALTSLNRFLENGEAEKLWEKFCNHAKVPVQTNKLEDLAVIFKQMSEEPGAVGVVGKSLTVRLISYRILSKTSNNR